MPAAHAFSDPLSEANRVFKTTFIQGPYSAYNMLDYLRQKAGVSWEDVLRHGIKRALGSVTRQDILNDKTPAFEATWRGVAGRCTSFAVQVTTILHARYPGVFDFDIYDLGKHRVARCKKTSILIDSSANQGAILLPEGHWVRMEGSDASWKWSKGKSKFERCENAKMKFSQTIIDRRSAMATCLMELLGATSIPTLFRSVDQRGNTEFHGLVSWIFQSRRLELTPRLHQRDHRLIIQFGSQGTPETEAKCVQSLIWFVNYYGGPYGKQQWASVVDAHTKIWVSASGLWGHPVLINE